MAALEWYAAQVRGKACRSCGAPLPNNSLESDPHSGGWEVEGRLTTQWLYVTCDVCDYQNSLWKLGVPR